MRFEQEIDTKLGNLYTEIDRAECRLDWLMRAGKDDLSELEDKITDLSHEMLNLTNKYTGWSRFYLVAGGHIHSSTHCSTCHKGNSRTNFGWLTSLSGLTEKEAVDEHGAILCTVCFPTAPTEWTNFYELKKEASNVGICPGSGTLEYPDDTARLGFYTGNYGVCKFCNEPVTVTTTGKMRKHKAK